ncbi:hypothetical protein JMJ35_001137 [Cladonia borealis]|uniref:Uncharacterized protein n=1 Tax=Cladonia borealis TaxID=184061 RepID=A0AA39RAA1_9LECA|nr:hypothetical protein JMJ35_001137 [Cladonia borealis]
MTTAYPPHRLHSSTQVSPSRALFLLSTYLEATATDPSLHPNALLTDNGPITPSSGSSTGLVLHTLKRVEAGLRGEHLAADLTFEKFDGDGLPELILGNAENSVATVDGSQMEQHTGAVEGEWQDKEEFEREQELVEGDIGDRDNAVEGGFREEGGKVPMVKAISTKSLKEKEERRKAKKERQKQRASLEARRKRERDAEG